MNNSKIHPLFNPDSAHFNELVKNSNTIDIPFYSSKFDQKISDVTISTHLKTRKSENIYRPITWPKNA